ncbi:MAG: DUF354 domain-containing protein [Bacteroidota bacterium]
MNILIDIGHPGHVHLFKHFAHIMIAQGHKVHFTVRDKEFEIELLKHEGFEFTNFGKHYKTKKGKIWGLFKFTFLLIKNALRFKPDIFLSHGSFYNAIASFFLRKPNLALEDTGNKEQVMLYKPFTEAIITSTSFPLKYGPKQIYYEGYHELAYLHPAFFKADTGIVKQLGVSEGEKYFILRFVSWDATHDVGQGGLSYEEKKQLIALLSKYGKVFISAEQELSGEFEPYRFSLPPYRMHDALACASLFVGEGATMASECGVLGTPSVYVNSLVRGYVQEQEQYGLVYNFVNGKGVLERVQMMLNDSNLNANCQNALQRLLADKINLTSFLVWFVENYPESLATMKKDPEYQLRFR